MAKLERGRVVVDAFVTDADLSRIRVSCVMPSFLRPDGWVHLALAWDETRGIRLYVNGRPAATKEARDSYAMLVEEHSNSPRFNLYNSFAADVNDLLRVGPDHWLGQTYRYDGDRSHPRPAFTQPAPTSGVPLWAFRQVEQLRRLKRFVPWYVDHHQIESGEFGGGLSDDGDLTNWWPGLALMGGEPGKVKESLLREMEAFYAQGMFTGGLSTIQTDEPHSYEEGIQVLSQSLLLDYGDPKQLERAMETSRAPQPDRRQPRRPPTHPLVLLQRLEVWRPPPCPRSRRPQTFCRSARPSRSTPPRARRSRAPASTAERHQGA